MFLGNPFYPKYIGILKLHILPLYKCSSVIFCVGVHSNRLNYEVVKIYNERAYKIGSFLIEHRKCIK